MTREEREKAIDALKISAPIMAMTQEEFNDYIQTLNKVMDWLEQEPKEGHWKIIPFGNNHGEYRPNVYECSECGWKIDLCRGLQQDTGHRLFCEHCGAKMFEPQERNDKECLD